MVASLLFLIAAAVVQLFFGAIALLTLVHDAGRFAIESIAAAIYRSALHVVAPRAA